MTLDTSSHTPGGRPCIHLHTPPPEILLLDRHTVTRLNFQPRLCVDPPCIAHRNGDILTLTFDATGHWTDGAAPHYGQHPHKYRYTLEIRDEHTVWGRRLPSND